MRLRSPLVTLSCLAVAVLASSACNLVFGIVSGEPTGGTGGTAGTGGTGGTTSSGSTTSTGTGGASCTPGAASCEGAVLHACDANGHPHPDVTCDAVAACDAANRACTEGATIGRLAVGEGRSCALEPDGSVRCWGINVSASLVLGDPHIFLTQATPMPGVTKVRQVAVGSGAQCVLQDDGSVICWGSNDSGELGAPGADVGTLAKAALPQDVHAVEIGAAHRCACARTSDGRVYCWGANDAGCLGNASETTGAAPTPALVPNVTGAVQLRVGAYSTPTCARTASGKVMCWAPTVAPTAVPGVDDAIDIAVGRRLAFIRSKSKGLLWTALTDDEKGWLDASPYAIVGEVAAMAAGDSFCALRTDGVVTCATLDDLVPPPLPSPIMDQPAGTVVEIAAGFSDTYAAGVQCLRLAGATLAGNVFCWGDDAGGTLGAGAPDLFRAPKKIAGLTGVASVSAGITSTTALMADGSIKVWGEAYGLHGQVESTPTTVGFLGNDNAFVSTDDPARRAYVVKKSGTLVLVDTGATQSNQRLLTTGASDFITARDLGNWDVGLRAGGTVVIHGAVAGANDGGVFGDGTTLTNAPENVVVAAFTDAKAVAVYGDWYGSEPAHLCAIHGAANDLACWGDDYHGEVGIGGAPGVVSTPSMVAIPNGEGIVSVAAGRAFTCAASAAGNVYCWGSNERGQLGDSSVQEIAVPNLVPNVVGAVGVTAGDAHACAWLSDESVVCWGANETGQLGDGTFDDRPQATIVSGLSNVVQVSAGTEHTCARHADGSLSCWGSSYSGQGGTGVVGYYAAPLIVQGL